MATTMKELEGLVNRLNAITGNAIAPYTKTVDGVLKANIGNYHLDIAYGGVMLVQMVTEGGGIKTITMRDNKKNAYRQIASYIAGIESIKAA